MSFSYLFFFGLIGLFFGSFANVIIFRLHTGEKGILKGRSHCQNCQHTLGLLDLFPVFSWIFLGGKCRYCHKKISYQYPLVELCMGLSFSLAYLASVWLGSQYLWFTIWLLVIFFVFLIIFVYDLKYMEIPDEVSLPGIVILFAFNFMVFTPTWQDALLGALIPLAFFGLQYLVSRGTWIGEGDFRLGVLMGLILGWKLTIVALFLAYLIGAIVGILVLAMKLKKFSSQLPFGPFLILGTLVALFWGQSLLAWYLGLLGI